MDSANCRLKILGGAGFYKVVKTKTGIYHFRGSYALLGVIHNVEMVYIKVHGTMCVGYLQMLHHFIQGT